jgi:hypothetical protein
VSVKVERRADARVPHRDRKRHETAIPAEPAGREGVPRNMRLPELSVHARTG